MVASNELYVFHQLEEFDRWRQTRVKEGQTMGLISTKVHQAHKQCDYLVLSVSLNVTQFPSPAHYELFPRQLTEDTELLKMFGNVDAIILPKPDELFRFGLRSGTKVVLRSDILTPSEMDDLTEGTMEGDVTTLLKLINIVQPHKVFLAHRNIIKQELIIRTLHDLYFKVDIVKLETERREDGVPHNARLSLISPAQLIQLNAVYPALRRIIYGYLDEVYSVSELVDMAREMLEPEVSHDCRIKMIKLLHPYGFQELMGLVDPAVGAVVMIQMEMLHPTGLWITFHDNVVLAPTIPAHEKTVFTMLSSALSHRSSVKKEEAPS